MDEKTDNTPAEYTWKLRSSLQSYSVKDLLISFHLDAVCQGNRNCLELQFHKKVRVCCAIILRSFVPV